MKFLTSGVWDAGFFASLPGTVVIVAAVMFAGVRIIGEPSFLSSPEAICAR